MVTWIVLKINNREIDEFDQNLDKVLDDSGIDLQFTKGKSSGK